MKAWRYAVSESDISLTVKDLRCVRGVLWLAVLLTGCAGDPVGRVVVPFPVGPLGPPPVVSQLSAVSVRSGDTITVRGTGLHSFTAPALVFVDGWRAAVVSRADTLLRAVVPPCLSGDEVWVSVERVGARSLPRPLRYEPGAPVVEVAPGTMISVDAAASDGCLRLGGDGAEYLVIGQFAVGVEVPRDVRVALSVSGESPIGAVPEAVVRPSSVAASFESVLRRREQLFARSARGGPRSGVRTDSPPPVVGSSRRYPVIATLAADRFDSVTTTLRYAGNSVLIWVDDAVSFSDTVLRPLGDWFDRELYPLGIAHFGAPSDIDGDGRVHVVLTPVVNGLTPRTQCSLSGYVAGFVSAHDLYPRTPNAAGAEVFYGFVPDPTGRWGCPHTNVTWGRTMPLTFVHELQHLINFHQKVFLRGGTEEAVWLNEGLSHYAEELASLQQERRYPWPAGRASPEQQFPDTAGWFILNNMINSYLFLREPYTHSLTAIAGGGTLEERGAGWLFVRWLADRFGEDIVRQMVQSPLRGAANVRDRTGVAFDRLAAEFSVMAYADSLPGSRRNIVAPELRLTSRNLRALFARLGVIISVPEFPIAPALLSPGDRVAGDLRSAGHLYARVSTLGVSSVAVRFTPDGGVLWGSADAPRLTIFRLP